MNMIRLFTLSLAMSVMPLASADEALLTEQAQQLVKAFAGELKPRLITAMQSGGPAHAVDVCSQQAPAIAARLSKESGWQVKRVSLKPRNLSTAIPNATEAKILQQFETELASGTPIKDIAYAGTQNGTFYYLKPQPVDAVCLACHGSNLSPEVTAALQQFVPGDTATGYKLGQIRGAFSVSRVIAESAP